MEVQNTQVAGLFSQFNQTSSAQSSDTARRPAPPPPQDALSGFMSQSKDDPEVKNFMSQVMDMEHSGEFDAAALADKAPDSLKSYAQQNGIELQSFFQSKHDDMEKRKPSMGQGGMMLPPMQYQQVAGDQSDNLMAALKSSLQIDASA